MGEAKSHPYILAPSIGAGAGFAGKPDLHYCQRTTASGDSSLRPAGYDLETDWRRYKWFNGKALIRKASEADRIHYCQLDWMKALQHRLVGTISHDRQKPWEVLQHETFYRL